MEEKEKEAEAPKAQPMERAAEVKGYFTGNILAEILEEAGIKVPEGEGDERTLRVLWAMHKYYNGQPWKYLFEKPNVADPPEAPG